jgi:hypothetical protein
VRAILTTHASIGRSILTNADVAQFQKEHGGEVWVLEDNFYGFRDLVKKVPNVRFGLRLPVVQADASERATRLCLFASDDVGVDALRKLYTAVYTSESKVLVWNDVQSDDLKNLDILVPFYTSFIAQNLFHFGCSFLTLDNKAVIAAGCKVVYALEDNLHPFDFQIRAAIEKLDVETVECKSILYKERADFPAYQMYAATCNRTGGKTPTFSNPNLNDCCSEEFCIEALK